MYHESFRFQPSTTRQGEAICNADVEELGIVEVCDFPLRNRLDSAINRNDPGQADAPLASSRHKLSSMANDPPSLQIKTSVIFPEGEWSTLSAENILVNRAPVLTLWGAVVPQRIGTTGPPSAFTLGKGLAGLTAQSTTYTVFWIQSTRPRGARLRAM